MRTTPVLVAAALLVAGCAARAPKARDAMTDSPKSERTSFAADAVFLREHGELVVLTSPGGGVIAVSPKYQGRVMTSAVAEGGDSLGWIHRAFIAAGKTGTPFDNYGGEDRFWLGPEGGQFGLYFPPENPSASTPGRPQRHSRRGRGTSPIALPPRSVSPARCR